MSVDRGIGAPIDLDLEASLLTGLPDARNVRRRYLRYDIHGDRQRIPVAIEAA